MEIIKSLQNQIIELPQNAPILKNVAVVIYST